MLKGMFVFLPGDNWILKDVEDLDGIMSTQSHSRPFRRITHNARETCILQHGAV